MVYMPCVASLLASSIIPEQDTSVTTPPPPSARVENMPLWLPSSLPASMPAQLHITGLSPGLLEKETKLRLAQADDALAEIRRQRRIVTGLVIFKKLNVLGRGQKKNTRMHMLFKRFSNKTERVVERYRAACRAVEVLDPEGTWQTRLQVLHREDIRGPGREEIDKHDRRPEACEKRREQSWIWLVPRVETMKDIGVVEEHLDSNLRVEWAKSRARAARWTEEVDLLLEEMRHTLVFLEWKAEWWKRQARRCMDAPEPLRGAIEAYALRQAALQQWIANGHAKRWLPVLKDKGFMPCWVSRYSDNHSPAPAQSVKDQLADDEVESDEDDEDADGEIVEEDIQDDYETDL
jgi:hypothetical protein